MAGVEIKELGDVLAGLSVQRAGALAAYLREAYGIEASSGPAVVQSREGERTEADATPEAPAVVDVVLLGAGEKKISVIRVVRQHTGLGLKEAKDLVDGAPAVVKAGVERAEAERIAKELAEAGGRVALK